MGPLRCIDMTSVTSPQQTSRGGADIPGPRGGQVVRLLVLGSDADAQELRDQATAAGFELAVRYSARVSHVAYGSGVNPQDAKYNRIREAGIAMLPIQSCTSQLGLVDGEGADLPEREDGGQRTEEGGHERHPEQGEEAREDVGEAIAEAELAKVVAVVELGEEMRAEDVAEGDVAERDAETETEDGEEEVEEAEGAEAFGEVGGGLEFPALRREDVLEESAAGLVPGFDRFDDELGRSVADAYAPLETLEEMDDVSGTMDELPLGAVVIGVDPWTGAGTGAGTGPETEVGTEPQSESEAESEAGAEAEAEAGTEWESDTESEDEVEEADVADVADVPDMADAADYDSAAVAAALMSDLEATDAPVTAAAAAAELAADAADAPAGASADAAAAPSRGSAGYVLLSLAWALVPFVTFGLLTPIVFGYAGFRLRSRMLGVVALGYTVAVVLSFALSANRPSGTSPTGVSGTILTLALATAWIGGTVHALSLRAKVFAVRGTAVKGPTAEG